MNCHEFEPAAGCERKEDFDNRELCRRIDKIVESPDQALIRQMHANCAAAPCDTPAARCVQKGVGLTRRFEGRIRRLTLQPEPVMTDLACVPRAHFPCRATISSTYGYLDWWRL